MDTEDVFAVPVEVVHSHDEVVFTVVVCGHDEDVFATVVHLHGEVVPPMLHLVEAVSPVVSDGINIGEHSDSKSTEIWPQ